MLSYKLLKSSAALDQSSLHLFLVSELDARIRKAASTFRKLRCRVWANQHLSLHVKIRVYVACALNMLLCGCETWPTYRYQEKRLNARATQGGGWG